MVTSEATNVKSGANGGQFFCVSSSEELQNISIETEFVTDFILEQGWNGRPTEMTITWKLWSESTWIWWSPTQGTPGTLAPKIPSCSPKQWNPKWGILLYSARKLESKPTSKVPTLILGYTWLSSRLPTQTRNTQRHCALCWGVNRDSVNPFSPSSSETLKGWHTGGIQFLSQSSIILMARVPIGDILCFDTSSVVLWR